MAEEKLKLLITPCPHKKDRMTGNSMMIETIIALLPATAAGVFFFGSKGLLPILFCVITAAAAETIMVLVRRKKLSSADISSSALTGLLLSLSLPPGIPWWAASAGAVISIVAAKHLLGGLGYNIFNPAMVGRAFLMSSWPLLMTTWLLPAPNIDAVTTATPLALAKAHESVPTLLNMFLGLRSGCLGETCALALLLGAAYLLLRKIIEWRIPLSYIATVLILAAMFGQDPVFHLLAGGLLLGAFFMATDPVTSPVTKPGRWAFGIGCGALTMTIRLWGGYPEGVCYAILIMNAVVPLFDRYLRGRTFGT